MGKDSELLEAARNGNLPVLKKILSAKAKKLGPLASLRRGPGPNVQDSNGYTLLHHASLNGHRDVVSLLLEHEASTNVQDLKGSTPLHLAAWGGHTDVVQSLLLQGPSQPNVNHRNRGGETALHFAAQYGHTDSAKLLISRGGDPTLPNAQAETPLDLAAQYGRLSTAELLLKACPDLLRAYTATSATAAVFPHTPLHRASRNGHLSMVKLLLSSGHYVNVRTGHGSPLHEAALCGKVDVVRTLLETGGDPEVLNDLGLTVLDTICSINTPVTQEITAMIKSHGLLVDLDDVTSLDDPAPISPLSIPFMSSLMPECGSPYENVLIPTRLHATSAAGELDGATGRGFERRTISRSSDRESRMSAARSSVGSRSDRSSDVSVYDVPKSFGERGCQMRHSSSNKSSTTTEDEGGDSVYEVPPPPRACRISTVSLPACSSDLQANQRLLLHEQMREASSKLSKFASSASVTRRPEVGTDVSPHVGAAVGRKLSDPIPPPKPPRRSVCPPSPSQELDEVDDDGSYETICFRGASVEIRSALSSITSCASADDDLADVERSSDSDEERCEISRPRQAKVDAKYTEAKFQPVKSKRTSKSHNYENTNHDYENTHTNEPTSREESGGYARINIRPRNVAPAEEGYARVRTRCHTENNGYARVQVKRVTPAPPVVPTGGLRDSFGSRPRAFSAYENFSRSLAPASGSSSDEELERRPNSLEFEVTSSAVPLVPPLTSCPLSPTNYQQPPTPDHPPPSAVQARLSIHEKIRPLSQEEPLVDAPKRTSRDIETETVDLPDEDEILKVELSSVSGSPVSTCTIEEVTGVIPFAGLLRGSIKRMEAATGRALDCASMKVAIKTSKDAAVLLSPLEEAEEWARINDIMTSFGGGLARESVFMAELEQEFQSRLGLSLSPSQQGLQVLRDAGDEEEVDEMGSSENLDLTCVGRWLTSLGLPQYEDVFLNNGYDDTEFMNGGILELCDLEEMSITNANHVETILKAITRLPTPLVGLAPQLAACTDLEEWLTIFGLQQYVEVFGKNGFGSMERVRKIWEIELTAVLEVTKLGHRKRMLVALGERPMEPQLPPSLNPHDLSLELSKLNSDITQLKEQIFSDLPSSSSRERRPPESATNTIRRSTSAGKKRLAPAPPPKAPRAQPPLDSTPSTDSLDDLDHLSIRDPSQLVVGATTSKVMTKWRHHPAALISSSVQYVAQYLGSTHVKTLKGTHSTMQSIHKLKKSTAEGAKVPRIVLSVSYRGVKFINAVTQMLVCEHEIRNIHCACQDADDLSHFAYITKDLDTNGHYCHVFRVQSRDLATEIILTLGEAFEVAYQLAMRDTPGHLNQSDEQKLAHGHSRSKSEHMKLTPSLSNGSGHTRSSSAAQPLPLTKKTSSSADNLLSDDVCKEPARRKRSSSSTAGKLEGSPKLSD